MNIPQSSIEPFGVIGIPVIDTVPTVTPDKDYIAYKLQQYARVVRRAKLPYSIEDMALRLENVALDASADGVYIQVNTQTNPQFNGLVYSVFTLLRNKWRKTVVLIPTTTPRKVAAHQPLPKNNNRTLP